MQESFYRQTGRIEDGHWWFVHRRRMVDSWLLGEAGPRGTGLDVGCGSGGNLSLLARHCADVVGLDRNPLPLGLARAKHPGARLVQGDANALARLFRPASLGLITLFNVLYHRDVASPRAVLAAAASLLQPGGRLVLTEPAFRTLARCHDRLDHGARRFRVGELRDAAIAAGLLVRRATYFNAISLPAVACLAALDRLGGRHAASTGEAGELTLPPTWLQRPLLGLLAMEQAWIAHVGRLPAGVGVALLAVRGPGAQVRT